VARTRAPKERERTPIKISINRRTHGASGADDIVIDLVDDKSGCHIADVFLSMETFGRAITGLSYLDAEAMLNLDGPIGCSLENKDIEVTLKRQSHKIDTGPTVGEQAAVRPYEVDGWMASWSDLRNHHRWVRKDDLKSNEECYRVNFHRFMRPDGTPWTR
jgi:hypothetical protein